MNRASHLDLDGRLAGRRRREPKDRRFHENIYAFHAVASIPAILERGNAGDGRHPGPRLFRLDEGRRNRRGRRRLPAFQTPLWPEYVR